MSDTARIATNLAKRMNFHFVFAFILFDIYFIKNEMNLQMAIVNFFVHDDLNVLYFPFILSSSENS